MSKADAPLGRGPIYRLHRLIRSNWISSFGAALATLTVMLFITTLFLSGSETWGGPYIGILNAVILPLFGLAGLLMIPIGLFLYRKQLKARIESLSDSPMNTARAVVALTIINFLAVGTTGYSSAKYLSSEQFCGMACHQVMGPEYGAYKNSFHSNIGCVVCHVDEGAGGYIRAKLNGTHQLIGTIRDNYNRPIPTPVVDLPPTSVICEKCHSATRYLGTKLLVRTHYEPNEKSTGFVNVLLMRRGGELPGERVSGIHWHAHPSSKVEFLAGDDRRTTIPWVRAKYPDGSVKTFVAEGYDKGTPAADQLRRMDCSDCHNRVGHPFETAEEVVDNGMSSGMITRELPFIRKRAVEVLQGPWRRDNADAGIRKTLNEAYAGADGKPAAEIKAQLDRSAETLVAAWLRNNDPDRKLTWGSYPDFKTHAGCFRCHDDKHKDDKGVPINSKCAVCHVVLSERQEDPMILKALGIRSK
jgi:hypothetical protein